MRIRRISFGDAVVDTQALVAQMDATVAQLRNTWNDINSRWAILLSQGLVEATDGRMASLNGIINDLDVGGVGRQHVFFPLDGQTQDEAWATWVDTANYVKTGLQQVGGVITNWSLSNVVPRVVGDVGNTFKATGDFMMGALGLVAAIVIVPQLLQVVRTQQARKSLSGYARSRRKRR